MIAALAPTLLGLALIAACPQTGPRHHCVVDGDTVWWQGEKIRLADIDAPEMSGQCEAERRRARAARDRLIQLINAGELRIARTGRDRYGRTLARLGTEHGGIGERLLSENLAVRWPHRRSWCQHPGPTAQTPSSGDLRGHKKPPARFLAGRGP
jgi:endonuclease YncB( thermonuclease family)